MQLVEESTNSPESARSSSDNTSETSSGGNSPTLSTKTDLTQPILPQSAKSSSETDSDDNSPRQSMLTPDEEKLYRFLQENNLHSLEVLWAENGPMHQALKDETWGNTYFKQFNPTIWLMHHRCKTGEELRQYLISILAAIISKDKAAQQELVHFQDQKPQKQIIDFISKQLLPILKIRGLNQHTKLSLEQFTLLIANLNAVDMAEIYQNFKNSVTRSIAVSTELSPDQCYAALQQLFLGELKDYQLFNEAYGFSNYATQKRLGEGLDSNQTAYSTFNPIIQNINDKLADVYADDLKDPVNRWKTIYQSTNDLFSQQKNLDELVDPSSKISDAVRRNVVNHIEAQREFMANFQGPTVALIEQQRVVIADHFKTTYNRANQEIYKYLYFRQGHQTALAQFLNMPANPLRYDLFLTAAAAVKNLAPHKQALVNILHRFNTDELNQRGFHANLKKIIYQYGAPKHGLKRLFAFVKTLFQEHGAAHRLRFREVDQLRLINHNLKATYRENHREVTRQYIKNINQNSYDQFRAIRTHELQRLNELEQQPHFSANKTKVGLKTQLRQAQNDPAQKDALRKLHFLSQNRRLIRDNVAGVVRQYEQQRNHDSLATEIETTVIENRKPLNTLNPAQKREMLKQTKCTKAQLQRFMNDVERLRFKADINEEIVAQAVQPANMV